MAALGWLLNLDFAGSGGAAAIAAGAADQGIPSSRKYGFGYGYRYIERVPAWLTLTCLSLF